MEPTEEMKLWDATKDIKAYADYCHLCAQLGDTPVEFEEYITEDSTDLDEEYANTNAWGFR